MTRVPENLEIVERRHQGPVRVTYLARQMPLGRAVQLVGLAQGVLSSSPLAKTLLHEAEALAGLDHPNIVRLYDLKRSETDLWLVLEDVDGPTLSTVIAKKPSWQAVAAIGLDVARALVHAHAVGQTHGHLSSRSVQFTRSGRTKVSGFGARLSPQADDAEALEPHSPGGLSPEGSIGQTVGPLSDLFAWGSLMYELLTTQEPFGSPDESHYASRVRNDRQKSLLLVRPDLPVALDQIISRCLEKLPAARPANAAEIAEQLQALIGNATAPLISQELGRLGFIASTESESIAPLHGAAPGGRPSAPPPQALVRFGIPLIALALGILVATLSTIYFLERKSEEQAPTQVRELPAEEALLLRVIATPWAHVLVDGQHRETTPFAQPLALTPGKHTIRLEHPNAAPEERLVEGRAGQAVLLNVQMHVERPLSAGPSPEVPEETTP